MQRDRYKESDCACHKFTMLPIYNDLKRHMSRMLKKKGHQTDLKQKSSAKLTSLVRLVWPLLQIFVEGVDDAPEVQADGWNKKKMMET